MDTVLLVGNNRMRMLVTLYSDTDDFTPGKSMPLGTVPRLA